MVVVDTIKILNLKSDILAPNRHQAISNLHADLTVAITVSTHGSYHATYTCAYAVSSDNIHQVEMSAARRELDVLPGIPAPMQGTGLVVRICCQNRELP